MSASLDWKVDTSGIDTLLIQYPQQKKQFMDAVAEVTVGNMKDSFGTSPPGQSYSRGKKRTHVASVQGYPPNVDYGDLTNSLRWERKGADTRAIYGAEHALYLEDSTELDRPFIGPAVQNTNKVVPSLGMKWLRLGE